MTHCNKFFLLVLLATVFSSDAAPIKDKQSYWQCLTHDAANKTWSAKNGFQKVALNLAFASCKKESEAPATCKTTPLDCEGFNMGLSTKPMWQCTALDLSAQAWRSNFYVQRDDAALGAKLFCKDKSSVPESCYINFVTCANNNGAHL